MRAILEHRRERGVRGRTRQGEGGFSLIEVMIAIAVLGVGMLGAMMLMLMGMQGNSSAKTDTTSTVLDQEIIELYSTIKTYPKPGTVTINDCALTGSSAHLASLGQSVNPGSGAVLYTTASAPSASQVGDIDWTQPVGTLATGTISGYAMEYQSCSGDIYEVRWNVMDVTPATPPTGTTGRLSLLTVSARPRSAVVATSTGAQNRAILYAVPVTMRSLLETNQ
jgi:prepilin-type N-terminal cleavage/methylation domain-containing protein